MWSSGESSWLHNGDVLCFLWGTNWIYICYVEESRPLLWSSGQSSWLQIQRSCLDSRRYQLFWEVVCLERGPLSLVSTTEELLGRKSSGSGVENREYGRMDPSRWQRGTLYPTKVGTSFAKKRQSVGRSVQIKFVSNSSSSWRHQSPRGESSLLRVYFIYVTQRTYNIKKTNICQWNTEHETGGES
jgi:hypothetical protein